MRISVVICTLNRAPELRLLLQALPHQDHADFEVVVVAGPSTDETDEVLAQHADRVRAVRNPEANLSRSRNLGIAAAAGELVAFIDDDAVPEPRWLARFEQELRGDPALAGLGGFVRIGDGIRWQQRYVVSTRTGETIQRDDPPLPEMSLPGADPFVFAMGCNGCYRRDALERVGGFDEEIEYYLDENDVAMRLIDAGLPMRQIDGAAIIHRSRASGIRDASGRLTDAFAVVKNHTYFARMNRASGAEESIARWAEFWRQESRTALENGQIDEEECRTAIARVDEGLAAGEASAARGERKTRSIAPADPDAFLPYPTIERSPGARRAAFVSSGYPPDNHGGIARYTQDLATGLAARGWEMHVVVPEGDQLPSLEFEGGVWVHRVPAPRVATLPEDAVSSALARSAAGRAALVEVEERFGPLAVVSAPLWSGEALVASLDDRWPTVTTLMTPMHTVTALYPEWPPALVVRLLDLESETLRHARHLHAISQAVLDDVRSTYARETAETPADVVHLGVPERRGAGRPPAAGGSVRLLYVGRLERRKGIDTLLEAIPSVLERHPEAELLVVGRDVDGPFEPAFAADHPGLASRVRFAGEVDEEALQAAYDEADVFVAPSTYESFGLVHAEAMMMGLPVVTCPVGGVVELVDDGETGLLVDAGDAPALAQALDALVTDGERRRAMGEAARRRYEERFSLERAVDGTARAYGAVAERHARSESSEPVMARKLGEALERLVARPAPAARKLAETMLAGPTGDPLVALSALWSQAPDAEFVDGLYLAVLGRAPEEAQRPHLIAQLAAGQHRGELVREVGWSAEGRARPRGTEWLGRLFELEGWREEDACRSAFSRPLDERFVQDVVDLLVLDPRLREPARTLVGERLAAGDSRHGAALALLRSGLDLRPAPDFDGWEPMLAAIAGEVGGAAPAPAGRRPRVRSLARRTLSKAGALRRAPGELRDATQRLRVTEVRSIAMAEAIGRVEAQQRADGRRLEEAQERQRAEYAETLTALRKAIEATGLDASRQQQLQEGVEATAVHSADTMRMTDFLLRKLDAVAVDLRDRLPPSLSTPDLPEPQVMRELPHRDVKLNLGAGEKPVPGYVNVDARPLPDIDVVADVRRLPFAEGSLAEIMSAHLVEHFRQNQLEVAVLPYWRSLLRPDGVLRVICPNWEEMTRRLADGRLSWHEYKLLTFGLQDYDGDDHFAMYTPASLAASLRAGGFAGVEVVVADRQNGICPEMELTAHPDAAPRRSGDAGHALAQN